MRRKEIKIYWEEKNCLNNKTTSNIEDGDLLVHVLSREVSKLRIIPTWRGGECSMVYFLSILPSNKTFKDFLRGGFHGGGLHMWLAYVLILLRPEEDC